MVNLLSWRTLWLVFWWGFHGTGDLDECNSVTFTRICSEFLFWEVGLVKGKGELAINNWVVSGSCTRMS